MDTVAKEPDNLIQLDQHPRAWTDPGRVERFLRGKRVEAPIADAAVRFARAVPSLDGVLPRSWTAPLIASLPSQPTATDLEVAVAGAARYFEYLEELRVLPRCGQTQCEYDLLTSAHIVEELMFAGFDRERMAWCEQHGAAERVRAQDARFAAEPGQTIAPDVSWLGGWVQYAGQWVVLWLPAGGGVALAGASVNAHERSTALAALFVEAFLGEVKRGRAPARLAVFSAAQERAMRDFTREADAEPLTLYRLREASALRFWAAELVHG